MRGRQQSLTDDVSRARPELLVSFDTNVLQDKSRIMGRKALNAGLIGIK